MKEKFEEHAIFNIYYRLTLKPFIMLDTIVMVIFGILFFWLIGSTDREDCRLECNCSKCKLKNKGKTKK